MAILCLAESLPDLKQRISKITVGQSVDKTPVTVADLGVAGAMTALLRDALSPTLSKRWKTIRLLYTAGLSPISHTVVTLCWPLAWR